MATIKDIIVRVRADTSSLASGLAGASGAVTKFSSKMSSTGRSLQRNVSVPLLAVGAASVKMAYDFDESFVKIGALVGASKKDIEGYKKAVLELSGETAQAPKDLADALYFVTSSGFEGASALRVLESSAKASAAGLGDTVTVADAVTSAVNAYGEKTLSAASATDVLVGAVREGKGEASEMAGVIGRVIPLAAELDVTFQDVGAAMASMTLSGLDAAEATTALRGIFTTLLKPSLDGEKALKQMGLTVDELRDSMAERGLLETLMMLKDELGENKEAMAAIFPNVRALAGFLNLTGQNAAKNSEIFKELRDDVNATGEAFDKTARSDGFKFRKALAELQAAAIELGQQLIPILVNDVIPAVRSAIKWWKGLSDESKSLALKLAGLAILSGPLLRLGGALGKIVGWLMKWSKVPKLPAGGGIPTALPGKVPGGGGGILPAIGRAAGRFAGAYAIGDLPNQMPQDIDELITKYESMGDAARMSIFGVRSANEGLALSIKHLNGELEAQGSDVRINAQAFNLAANTQLNYRNALRLVAAGIGNVSGKIGSQLAPALAGAKKLSDNEAQSLVGLTRRMNNLRGPLTQTEQGYIQYMLAQGDAAGATEYLSKLIAIARNNTTKHTKANKDAGRVAGMTKEQFLRQGEAAERAGNKTHIYGRKLGALPKRVETKITADTSQGMAALAAFAARLREVEGMYGGVRTEAREGGSSSVPNAHTGARVVRGGVVNLRAGEVVKTDDEDGRALKVIIGRDQVIRQLTYARDYGGRD